MRSKPGCEVGHLAGFKTDCSFRQRMDWESGLDTDVCGQGAGQADPRQTGAGTAAAKMCQMESLPSPLPPCMTMTVAHWACEGPT